MKHLAPISKLLLLALSLRLLIMFFSGFHPDLLNHLDWGIRFLDLGPARFYENIFWSVSWPNQPAGTIYLFAFIALIKNIIFSILWILNLRISFFPSFIFPLLEASLHVWLVKLPFILADLGLGWLIYRTLAKSHPRRSLIASAFFLFNPAVIYNSTVWGQTDSLINLLALAGLFLVYHRRFLPGLWLFFASFLFKLSLVIYLPVLAVILWHHRRHWLSIILSLLTFFGFVLLFILPFSYPRSPVWYLNYMYVGKVFTRQGDMLNGNAFNLWLLAFGVDFSKTDTQTVFGFTYRSISQFALALTSLPLLVSLVSRYSFKRLVLALFIIAFSAFMLLTNMHERYLYPIFPLFSLLLVYFPNIFSISSYLLITLIHLLNLYNLWFYPSLPYIKAILIAREFLAARLLTVVLLIFYAKYYVQYLRSEK